MKIEQRKKTEKKHSSTYLNVIKIFLHDDDDWYLGKKKKEFSHSFDINKEFQDSSC